MVQVTIKVDSIRKIKRTEDALIFYTPKNVYICKLTQAMPAANQVYLSLDLKEGKNYGI